MKNKIYLNPQVSLQDFTFLVKKAAVEKIYQE